MIQHAEPSPSSSPAIRRAAGRDTVQATLPDGRVYEAPVGTTVGAVFRQAAADRATVDPGLCEPLVAAVVDGRLRELTVSLTRDAFVTPVSSSTGDGARIYRRSLAFLLITAAAELYPEAVIGIEHSAATAGGYFCEVTGRAPLSNEELQTLESHMRELVELDAPITRVTMSTAEATELFRARGEDDKARLLAHRKKGEIALNELRGRRDYFQGYMAESTGVLRHFALHGFPPGFMLQFPHQSRPSELGAIVPYPKMFAVFDEAGNWLDRLGIRGTGALNDAIADGRLPEVCLVAEALHEARIARIAADIAAAEDRVILIFIAGPSSSGKTTFSKRLAVQLLANGRRPLPIQLDDYFVDRELTPRDASGQYDFESLQAVNLPLFNEHLRRLMAGQTVQLPRYSFVKGRSEPGHVVSLGPDHIVIAEGIHGLNPALVPGVPSESVYRVYVSALTQLNLDRHNRVSTSDCRLIRRIVRDAATRGYSATDTLRRWEAVMRGEKHHIFPYQENGDAVFNSSLVYELAVLRPFAEPLLLQVRPDAPEYVEANRLLSFLQWFLPAPADPVPDNSILREFIGGSILENFRLWPGSPVA